MVSESSLPVAVAESGVSAVGDIFNWIQDRPIIYGSLIVIGIGSAACKAVREYQKYNRRVKWNSKKNLVILHTYSRACTIPNVSPCGLKLETYLRMAAIPYELDFDEPTADNGKTPWITINGETVNDSQLAVEYLGKHFHEEFTKSLGDLEKATIRAIQIMVEDHLYWSGALWRYVFDETKSFKKVFCPSFLTACRMKCRVQSRANSHGMGQLKPAEALAMGHKDMNALSKLLGDKKFFGGELPCEADCSIFGHLAQALWAMPSSPHEAWIKDEFPNLKEYCLRMKKRFWSDWSDVCATDKPSVTQFSTTRLPSL